MKQFIALNAKCYSYTYDINKDGKLIQNNTKILKGVSKAVVDKTITHSDYKHTLETHESACRNVKSIVSKKHQIYTESKNKIALTFF